MLYSGLGYEYLLGFTINLQVHSKLEIPAAFPK